MIRLRIGVFVLCAAAFALASCDSDLATGPSDDGATYNMVGPWTSTSVGSPARAYGTVFSGGTTSNGWTTYSGMYSQTVNGQNGILLATARKYVDGPNVEMTFGADKFHGKFVSADTIVGTMKIESIDYPITFARGF